MKQVGFNVAAAPLFFISSTIESVIMEFEDIWYEYQILIEKKVKRQRLH